MKQTNKQKQNKQTNTGSGPLPHLTVPTWLSTTVHCYLSSKQNKIGQATFSGNQDFATAVYSELHELSTFDCQNAFESWQR